MDLYDLNVYNEGFIFIAPNATVVGDVFLGADIAIWHGTVIRGDINRITYFLIHLA
jgi:carbonic anhydrase/acetyltransferase-like protein (isoleucine patch superfamily)